jgi:hypothetical protein
MEALNRTKRGVSTLEGRDGSISVTMVCRFNFIDVDHAVGASTAFFLLSTHCLALSFMVAGGGIGVKVNRSGAQVGLRERMAEGQ